MLKDRLARRFALAGAFTALLAAGAAATSCIADAERIILIPPPGYRADLWPVGARIELHGYAWGNSQAARLLILDAEGQHRGEAYYALVPPSN